MASIDTASLTIAELREFAGFSSAEQRYIKRSLDIGLGRQDAFRLWARTPAETAAIRSQYVLYQELKPLRGEMADGARDHGGFEGVEQFMGTLIRLTAFDLAQERLKSSGACSRSEDFARSHHDRPPQRVGHPALLQCGEPKYLRQPNHGL